MEVPPVALLRKTVNAFSVSDISKLENCITADTKEVMQLLKAQKRQEARDVLKRKKMLEVALADLKRELAMNEEAPKPDEVAQNVNTNAAALVWSTLCVAWIPLLVAHVV
eukprot:TRINITY_DN24200_c0_g1_i1.p1 TRINITY_DN24200_c0_g1~~TRINITY_DN24200_c0_g1_i1.p1  ORF type:complete len:129 (+),score=44.46 TRINITY_DN24200_c0_g1_i1:58-387(+)